MPQIRDAMSYTEEVRIVVYRTYHSFGMDGSMVSSDPIPVRTLTIDDLVHIIKCKTDTQNQQSL